MTSLLNKKLQTVFLLAILFFANNIAFSKDEEIPDVPNPPRLVNDFANIISDDNEQRLEEKLLAYSDSTSSQIAVVTVNTVGDYAIDDFGIRLARKWAIGQKDKDNGILILIAKDDRKMDIEVGSRLEGLVSNYDCIRIINDLMLPAFKQSNYYKGIDDATDRIFGLLNGSFKPSESDYKGDNEEIPIWAIILFIIIVLIIFSKFSSGKNGGYTGGSGGWISTGGSSWSGGGSSGGFGGFGGGGFSGGGGSGSW
jgi:uncharacterized protein